MAVPEINQDNEYDVPGDMEKNIPILRIEGQKVEKLMIDDRRVRRMKIDDETVYETDGYDWYISTNGSNDNDGKSIGTAFADLTPLPDVVEDGDMVFVEGGNYEITSETIIRKSITIESDPNDKAVLDMRSNTGYCLYISFYGLTDKEMNLFNIDFTSSLTSGNRYLFRIDIFSNVCNISGCSFNNAYGQYDPRALDCRSMNGGVLNVMDCRFTNNGGSGYGHSLASCRAWGSSGTLRVYNSTFNNPSGGNTMFGGAKGRAICAGNGNGACNIDARGRCNEFLGTGDTCYNYVEEECDGQ